MKTEPSTILFAIFATALTCAPMLSRGQGFDETPFQYIRDVEVEVTEDMVGALRLDDDLFRNNEEDFSGLRILEKSPEGSQAVPYLIEKVSPPRTETPRTLEKKLLSLQETGENEIVVTSRIESDDKVVNRIEIQTTLKNFERRVTIEGSSDGESWQPLVENELIFDYSRFIDFRKTFVEIPETKLSFFRITVNSAVDQLTEPLRRITRTSRNDGMTEKQLVYEMLKRPFRIDSLSFRYQPEKSPETTAKPEFVDYETAELSASVDYEKKETIVSFESFHQPITRITIQTPERNFRRDVLIQTPITAGEGEETTWKTIRRGAIFHYDIGDLKEKRLTLEFPELRESTYRLVFNNGDNPPLAVSGVTTSGPAYQLLFLAQPGQEYRLYYGIPATPMKPPVYDTSAIAAANRKGIPAKTFQLRSATANPAFSQASPEKTIVDFLENKGLLWGVIALVVLVLIWVLFRTACRIETMEES